jgi:hypothetical protein
MIFLPFGVFSRGERSLDLDRVSDMVFLFDLYFSKNLPEDLDA